MFNKSYRAKIQKLVRVFKKKYPELSDRAISLQMTDGKDHSRIYRLFDEKKYPALISTTLDEIRFFVMDYHRKMRVK